MIIPTKEQIEAEIFKRSFYKFFKEAVKVLEPDTIWYDNWHIEYLCNELQKETIRIKNKEPKTKDLLINIPPRSLKSYITTITWNAWSWTFYPELTFLSSSHTDSLALEHATQTRRLIESDWYQKRWGHLYKLVGDQNTKSNFRNDKGGYRIAKSVGGSTTGSGAMIIICDDPLKANPSDNELQTANDWWFKTMSTRLNDQELGLRVVVMQRLHEFDTTGEILNGKGTYNKIIIPATTETPVYPENLKENYINGLFFPSRFSKQVLDSLKVTLGSLEYTGQYLQQPAPADGDLIKKEYFNNLFDKNDLPKNLVVNFYSDTGYGKEGSDNSATLAYTFFENNLYIISTNRVNLSLPDFTNHYQSYIKANNHTPQSLCYFEPKATGISVVQTLKKLGINAKEDKPPTESKKSRVQSILPFLESGRVFFNQNFNFDDLINECLKFPNGKNDDLVDCLSAVCRLVFITGGFSDAFDNLFN